MDSITQMALGAAVGEAVLGRRIGNRAPLWGAVLGTLPDLDVLVPLGDPVSDFTYHRSVSHSLIVLTLVAPLIAWLLSRRARGRHAPFRLWWLMVFLVLITHPLLDGFTVYGTQLLWPIDTTPVAWSSLFIIDPAYTLPLLVGVLGTLILARVRRPGELGGSGIAAAQAARPAAARATGQRTGQRTGQEAGQEAGRDAGPEAGQGAGRDAGPEAGGEDVLDAGPALIPSPSLAASPEAGLDAAQSSGQETGATSVRHPGRPWRLNAVGLVLSTLYIGWSLFAKHEIEQQARASLAEQGISYERLLSTPAPFNTLLWRLVIMDGDVWYEAFDSLVDGSDELRLNAHRTDTALLEPLADHWPVQRLQWFTHGFFRIEERAGEVRMTDLRMGLEPNYVFSFRVAVREGARLRPVVPVQIVAPLDLDRLGLVWERIVDAEVELGQ